MVVFFSARAVGQDRVSLEVSFVIEDSSLPYAVSLLIRDSTGKIIFFRMLSDVKRHFVSIPRVLVNGCLEVISPGFSCQPGRVGLNRLSVEDSSCVVFRLRSESVGLANVTIVSPLPQIIVKGDTVEYKIPRGPDPEIRKLRDVLKGLQGFQVDESGKIMYLGKEVSSILLDGEDLAGQDYRKLSENLSSQMVDKVQVLDNYNSNRILKAFETSGELALNIITPSFKKQSLSMNVLAGATQAGSLVLDAGFNLLSKKLRSLLFIQENNIGEKLGTSFESPEQDAGSLNDHADKFSYQQFLQSPQALQPVQRSGYTGKSRDGQVLSINGWSLGRTHFKSSITAADGRFGLSSGTESVTSVSPDIKWPVQSMEHLSLKKLLTNAEFSVIHDKMQNSVKSIRFYISNRIAGHHLTNHSSGAVSDSLLEQLTMKTAHVGAEMNATYRIRNKEVIQWNSDLHWVSDIEKLQLTTGRIGSFIGSVSTPADFRQKLGIETRDFSSTVTYLKKTSRVQYRSSVSISFESRPIRSNIQVWNIRPDTLQQMHDPNRSRLTRVLGQLKSSATIQLPDSWTSSLSIAAGLASQRSHETLSVKPGAGFLIQLQKKLSVFKSINFAADQHSHFMKLADYFTGPILTGSGSFEYGLDGSLFASINRSLSVSFLNANIFRGQHLFLSAVIQSTKNDNLPAQLVHPGYTVLRFMGSGKSGMISLLMNVSKSVLALNAKLSLNVAGSRMSNEYLMNEALIETIAYTSRVEGRYSGSFKKFGYDITGNLSFALSELNQPEGMIKRSFSRFEGVLRTRWKPGRKFRCAVDYLILKYQAPKAVMLVDLQASYRFSSRLTMLLNVHNLLDKDRVFFVNQSAVSSVVTEYPLVRRYALVKAAIDL